MSKKAFALRIDSTILDAMQRWADDDLRSINAQIEFVLRKSLRQSGRIKTKDAEPIVEEGGEQTEGKGKGERERDVQKEKSDLGTN